MDTSLCQIVTSPPTSRTPSKSFGSCLVTITQTNSNTKTTFKTSLTKLSSVNPSCFPETSNHTLYQKEIRREKNRLTAKLSRDRKNAYIHDLEKMLQDAKSRIDSLERELVCVCAPVSEPPSPIIDIKVKEEEEEECLALDDLPDMMFSSDDE